MRRNDAGMPEKGREAKDELYKMSHLINQTKNKKINMTYLCY